MKNEYLCCSFTVELHVDAYHMAQNAKAPVGAARLVEVDSDGSDLT